MTRSVQRTVDLRRPPARKRSARLRRRVPTPFQQVNPEPRLEPRRSARRIRVRYLHPDLRKPPSLIQLQPIPPHIRRAVHLHHHVGIRVLPCVQIRRSHPVQPSRVQEHHLVRLDVARSLGARKHPPDLSLAAEDDRRSPHLGDPFQQRPQHAQRHLVREMRRLARQAGEAGAGVEELRRGLRGPRIPRTSSAAGSSRKLQLGERGVVALPLEQRRALRSHPFHSGDLRWR